MSECAIRSACTRCAPRATNISPTMDLPEAIPPVRPIFSKLPPKKLSPQRSQRDTEKNQYPLCTSVSSVVISFILFLECSIRSPHLRRFHRIEHQHGNGQRPYPAGHRRDRPGNLDHFRMHIADQHRTFLAEGLFPLRIARKETLEL